MDIKDIKHIAGDLQKYLDDNQFDKIKTILDIANSCIDNKTIFNITQAIPVVKGIYGILKCGVEIRDWMSRRKALAFYSAFINARLTDKEVKKHYTNLSENELIEETGFVLLHVEKETDYKKALILGRIYYALLKRSITVDQFRELSDVTGRMFLSDYETLKELYIQDVTDMKNVNYRHDRLIGLGLARNINRTSGSMFIDIIGEKGSLVGLTGLGKTYCEIAFPNISYKDNEHEADKVVNLRSEMWAGHPFEPISTEDIDKLFDDIK